MIDYLRALYENILEKEIDRINKRKNFNLRRLQNTPFHGETHLQ